MIKKPLKRRSPQLRLSFWACAALYEELPPAVTD
jgi:hypothetical protein